MSHDFEPEPHEKAMIDVMLKGNTTLKWIYDFNKFLIEERTTQEIIKFVDELLHQELQKAREQSGKRNAVVKEYKDEGVMFVLKVEDGKTYEASMPIPKWAEVGKLTLRDQSELDQPTV